MVFAFGFDPALAETKLRAIMFLCFRPIVFINFVAAVYIFSTMPDFLNWCMMNTDINLGIHRYMILYDCYWKILVRFSVSKGVVAYIRGHSIGSAPKPVSNKSCFD
jgi:hypothetical protein